MCIIVFWKNYSLQNHPNHKILFYIEGNCHIRSLFKLSIFFWFIRMWNKTKLACLKIVCIKCTHRATYWNSRASWEDTRGAYYWCHPFGKQKIKCEIGCIIGHVCFKCTISWSSVCSQRRAEVETDLSTFGWTQGV